MSFTTVESVALFLNRDIADFTALELAQVAALIINIDGIINNYCGWTMTATDYTDKRFNGSGTDTLDLRVYPINSVTSVRLRDTEGVFTDITDSIEILDDGILQILPYQGVSGATSFTSGKNNCFITFNAGFEDGSIPHELEYAANQLASLNFNKITDENLSAEEEVFDNIRFKNNTLELPLVVRRNLDRYRLISVY